MLLTNLMKLNLVVSIIVHNDRNRRRFNAVRFECYVIEGSTAI